MGWVVGGWVGAAPRYCTSAPLWRVGVQLELQCTVQSTEAGSLCSLALWVPGLEHTNKNPFAKTHAPLFSVFKTLCTGLLSQHATLRYA